MTGLTFSVAELSITTSFTCRAFQLCFIFPIVIVAQLNLFSKVTHVNLTPLSTQPQKEFKTKKKVAELPINVRESIVS